MLLRICRDSIGKRYLRERDIHERSSLQMLTIDHEMIALVHGLSLGIHAQLLHIRKFAQES